MMRNCSLLLLALFVAFSPLTGFATEPRELNDAILYFVNDPQQITFCNVNKLVERNRLYQLERKNLDEAQVQNFFEHMQTHGVIDAGTGANQCEAAYVVQNRGTDLEGVIVIKGNYDREKLIGYFRNNYTNHANQHADEVSQKNQFSRVHDEGNSNPYQESKISIKGHNAHVFPMPVGDRELIVVSMDKAVLISSADRGHRNLLDRTIDVMSGKLPMKPAQDRTQVTMTFAPTGQEKKQIEQRVWNRYDKQKAETLGKKKFLKKAGERFRQRVIRSKVNFMMDAMGEMNQSTFTVVRGNAGDMTKVAILEADFANPGLAKDVKKRLMKHMIKEIKRNDNVQDKFALGKISITTQGSKAVVRMDLQDSKEQLHCFNLISGYISKGLLERQ